jgi:glycopeptide antibiotics resistance protein
MSVVYQLQGAFGLQGFYLLVVGVLLLLLLLVRLLEAQGASSTARAVAWVALLATLAGVAEATLRPVVPPAQAVPKLLLDPIEGVQGWAGPAWRPVINNVGLFLPLGALAAAAMPRAPRSLLLVLLVGLSVGIETTQYLVPMGRVANAADVLANGTGAAIGLLLASLVLGSSAGRRAARRRTRESPARV